MEDRRTAGECSYGLLVYQCIKMLVPVLLQRLEATFGMNLATGSDRQEQTSTQWLLCGALQVCRFCQVWYPFQLSNNSVGI